MASRKNEEGIYVVYDNIDCDRYSFETTAEGIKSYVDLVVTEAKEKGMVGEGSFDFFLADTYYDGHELRVKYYFDRVENEKERKSREDKELKIKEAASAKRKAAAEKRKLKADSEYSEYIRLKEKFGSL